MNNNLKKAHQALLDGNREKIADYLDTETTPEYEIGWLLANSYLDDAQRILHLQKLIQKTPGNPHNDYQSIAHEIILREEDMRKQLSPTPIWQILSLLKIYTISNWKRDKYWFFSFISLVILIIISYISYFQ